MIQVTVNKADLDAVRDGLAHIKKGMESATARAINRTMTTVRSRVVKKVHGEARTYLDSLKLKQVRKIVRVERATFKKQFGRIKIRDVGYVDLVGKRFEATMPSGHKSFFRRVRGAKHRLPTTRGGGAGGSIIARMQKRALPIVDVRPDPNKAAQVSRVVNTPRLVEIINQESQDAGALLQKNLMTQADLIIRKGFVGKRGGGRF